MKLRNKVSVILLALWFVMVAIAYLGSQYILSKSYNDLEFRQAQDNLQRIDEAIQQLEESVSTMAASWSIWDDTYQFAVDKNKNYIRSNLTASSAGSTNMDMILYFDAAGKYFYGISISPDRTKLIPVPESILGALSPSHRLVSMPDVSDELHGLLYTPSGILITAGRPIVTSNNQGPVRGTLIMGKYLSPKVVDKIQSLTKLNFKITNLTAKNKSPATNLILKKLLQKPVPVIDQNHADYMTGYQLLRDINHQPIALMTVEMPRSINQFGIETIRYYNLAFLAYSGALIILLWYLLQNLLVKRLENLKAQLGDSDENNHHFNNLISVVPDEISTVASLYHQATHDPLTGLANRNLLEQAFNSHITRLPQDKRNVAILFLDIDHFKRVNDSLGHEIGDLLLMEVARRLNECLREHDIAVRLGGDEFVVMLASIDIQQVKIIVDRIYHSFSENVIINGHVLFVESSMGISIYPNDGDTISVLLKNADIALYHAKESGKNHYQYYSAELNQAIIEANKKQAELQHAIDNKELFLVYQPIYDVRTHRIISLEALIRWCHPTRGLLGASEIIPVAEKSGSIIPIGKWVLMAACEQAKKWQENHLLSVPVAVNISIFQTKNTSIHDLVSRVLDQTGLDPSLLELELTESSYVEITEGILNDMDLLKYKGVNLVVDDFGVGSSGLGYLRRLPVSKLKIDQSFIKDICSGPDDSAITLAIIAIAHQLDLHVIAEGVETREQFDFLKLNNVDAAQGNYLCKPISGSECEFLLRQEDTESVD